MTAHDHAAQPTPVEARVAASRPRWLVPGLLVALAIGGLVAGGVVSPSAVLYAGLFGGMILMHLGGHGHAHGGHRLAAGSAATGDADVPGGRSSGPGAFGPGLAPRLEEAGDEARTSETERHDHRPAHGCH